MALSPADFAAYSRATGAPYPESPQERAELAPEVLAFRRGQLAQPEQQSNLPAILGGTVLGLGALGAALAGTRRFARGTKTQSTPQRDLGIVRQAATGRTSGTTAPSTPAPPTPGTPPSSEGVAPSRVSAIPQATVNLDEYLANAEKQRRAEVYKKVAAKPAEDLPTVFIPKGGSTEDVLITDPNTGEIFRRGQSTGNIQNLSSQTIAALESGEDQMTGRTMRGVQRNEDLDVSQVNTVARQTGSADVASSLTPDGIPFDQTDFWGQPTIPQPQKIEQSSNRLLPAVAKSPREKAQKFLQSRFESLGETVPGRYRRERVMGSDPLIAEAAELYAATGDPSVLSRFSATPSSPLGVKPTVQMSINDENLPASQFFKPTGYPEYTGDLIQRDIELTNEISSLGAKQQELLNQAKELGEQEQMLRVAMDRDPAGGGAYTNMFGKVKYAQQNLQNPATLNVDLGDALAERKFIRGQINSLENLGTTYKLSDFQEGVRPYFEYDELGQIIPSTFELRAGRKSIELEPKTGGGRLVSEYDPKGQSGSTRGVYGIEQTSRRSSPTTQPTEMTMDELIREGLEQARSSPEGDVPIPPFLSELTEQQVTPQRRSSVNMSEAILRAARQQGNRNPRGGVLPDEITQLRQQMAQPYSSTPKFLPEGKRKVRGLGYERQGVLPGVTGYAARQRQSPADIAATQLEDYMSKLQRGRSTPLTSQAVIQPRLF